MLVGGYPQTYHHTFNSCLIIKTDSRPLRGHPLYVDLSIVSSLLGGTLGIVVSPGGGGAQVWKKTLSCRFKTEEKIYDSRRLYLYLLLISLSIRILFACIKSVWCVCVCALIRDIYVAVICALIRKEWCVHMWYVIICV